MSELPFTTDGMVIGEQRQAGEGRHACLIEKVADRSYRTVRYLDPESQADFEQFKATTHRVITDKFSPAESDISAHDAQPSDTGKAGREPIPANAHVQR